MATLKDVARLAEVDASTASRVLRGDPAQQVRPETRARILAAARTLEYRPNVLARSLRTKRTGALGLVVPSLDNIGFADVTHGIQQAAAEAGHLVVVMEAEAVPTGKQRHGDPLERLVGDGLVDGLIVAFATLGDRHVAQLAERGVPLVLVNRRTRGVSGSVVVDDERGSRMAVEHLAGLGHQRIGYVGLDAETDTATRRRAGYLAAIHGAGLGVDPAFIAAAPPTVEGGRAAITRILATAQPRPTAIFVASLMSSLGVRAGIVSAGLAIPRDISLVAFNDHPVADHLAPPLTTVRMPNLRMGREAVRMLLAALEGEPVGDVMVDETPEIVIRSSTAAP
jgi:LacI family transcriptional regulator